MVGGFPLEIGLTIPKYCIRDVHALHNDREHDLPKGTYTFACCDPDLFEAPLL